MRGQVDVEFDPIRNRMRGLASGMQPIDAVMPDVDVIKPVLRPGEGVPGRQRHQLGAAGKVDGSAGRKTCGNGGEIFSQAWQVVTVAQQDELASYAMPYKGSFQPLGVQFAVRRGDQRGVRNAKLGVDQRCEAGHGLVGYQT